MGGQPSVGTGSRARWASAALPFTGGAPAPSSAPGAIPGGGTRDAVVQLTGVSFNRGESPVLDRVSLEVKRGEFAGLVGPNGSGKTTLLRIVLGLERPASGDVRLFGQPVDGFREWWRIGYVPQRPAALALGFPATVREVVATGVTARSRGGSWRSGRPDPHAVRRALQWLGLEGQADRPVGRLSGGQQQRVFLARALVGEPELLILDEPLEGVDAATQERFFALLRRLRQERGITVLLVSHDIGTVRSQVTTLVGLNRRLFFHGPPEGFGPEEMARLYGFPVTMARHRR